MQPGQPNSSTAASNSGLPPVEPPSGRFIAQLFVVPGLIVLVVVMVLMGLFYLTSRQSPEYFLRQLDSDNADIRWRGAADLAQILKRPEAGSLRWKADSHFALELAQRLRTSLDELYRTEKETAEQQAEILAALRAEGAGSEARAAWARTALFYLDGSGGSDTAIVHVDVLLARCAEAQDRYLREQVALAFNFWDGPLAEPTLLKLARDDGHGTSIGVVGLDNGVFE